MVATGQINFIPKTQVVVPVYDKMASIMPHSYNLSEIEIFLLLRKNFQKKKEIVQSSSLGFTIGFC